MKLTALHDNVVLRHIPVKEQQTDAGLFLPKGAKGLKNQISAFEVVSVGAKAIGVVKGDIVLAPDAFKMMHKPGAKGMTSVLLPDLLDENGVSFIVVQDVDCKAIIGGIDLD